MIQGVFLLWGVSIFQGGVRTLEDTVALLQSLKLQILRLFQTRGSLTLKELECGFTLKLVIDMIRTYSQMHCTDKYSQHSSII